MPRPNGEVQLRDAGWELVVQASTWVDLGQLRRIVQRADELGWTDKALISAVTREHVRRYDVKLVSALVIESGPRPNEET